MESTNPRFAYGLITKPIVRCASTWSGPFCASSSITKIAISFQNLLRVAASTILPSADVVAGDAGIRRERTRGGAEGVVFAQRHDGEARQLAAAFLGCFRSPIQKSTRSMSRVVCRLPQRPRFVGRHALRRPRRSSCS